jgi:hypothetical protein
VNWAWATTTGMKAAAVTSSAASDFIAISLGSDAESAAD